MIHCLEALETPGQYSVNAVKTNIKQLSQTHCKGFIESIIYQMQLTNHLIQLNIACCYDMCSFIDFQGLFGFDGQ